MLHRMRRQLQIFALTLLGFATHAHAQTEEHADALVSGIISYVRWQPNQQQLNFCMIDGQAKLISERIFNPPSKLIQPRTVQVQQFSSNELLQNEASAKHCHILYFVNSSDKLQQRMINASSKNSLTISEENEQCRIGSAVCLYRSNQQFKFKINMDSLKQSQIEIDSKVLFLSKNYQGVE